MSVTYPSSSDVSGETAAFRCFIDAEFSQIETAQKPDVGTGGGGLSMLFFVGTAGMVLGALALLAIRAPVVTAAAAIAFGAVLVISNWAAWQPLTLPLMAARLRTHAPMVRLMASEVAAGSAGLQPWPASP